MMLVIDGIAEATTGHILTSESGVPIAEDSAGGYCLMGVEGRENLSETAIFGRVVEGSGELSRELAEHVLSLSISCDDQQRIDDLLRRNAEGGLSDSERQELENFNHIADLVSLWYSRARCVLKQSE